jgi:arabinofuranosyltransferase
MVVIRHAWISDDAFITLRTVRNLLDGEGARWNLHERVQSYTHPLWMLALTVGWGLLGQSVASVFVLSLAVSILTLYWIAFRLRLSAPSALLALAVVVASKSFIDYSTSGLENPLTHFLAVLLIGEHLRDPPSPGDLVAASRRKLLIVATLCGLIALNRMDAFLLALPLLASALWSVRATAFDATKTLVLGFVPFLAWEVFAIIYYGFPFPNTAYAKLASDTPTLALWAQGFGYYLSQLAFDPSSLLAIAAALFVLAMGRWRKLLPLGVGIALYLIYIVSIGGDFMAGRFFALPMLASALVLAYGARDLLAGRGGAAYAPAGLVLAVSLLVTPHPTLSHDVDYALSINPISKNFWDERGITDERAYYASSSSLLRASRNAVIPDDWRRARGLGLKAGSVQAIAQVGATGFYAPPTAILVDGYGLCDAYLARLPAADKVTWRIGHFGREIPKGYLDSLKQGRNLIVDPKLAWGYERVKRVVSGPIWSWERWKEIARLNLDLEPPPMPPAAPSGKSKKPATAKRTAAPALASKPALPGPAPSPPASAPQPSSVVQPAHRPAPAETVARPAPARARAYDASTGQ